MILRVTYSLVLLKITKNRCVVLVWIHSVFAYNLLFNKYLNNKVKTHFFYSKNNSVRSTVLSYLSTWRHNCKLFAHSPPRFHLSEWVLQAPSHSGAGTLHCSEQCGWSSRKWTPGWSPSNWCSREFRRTFLFPSSCAGLVELARSLHTHFECRQVVGAWPPVIFPGRFRLWTWTSRSKCSRAGCQAFGSSALAAQ